MADARSPKTPFEKVAAAFQTAWRTDGTGASTVESFRLDPSSGLLGSGGSSGSNADEIGVMVELRHGVPAYLVVRAEHEIAPGSGRQGATAQALLRRMQARLAYPEITVRRPTALERFQTAFAFRPAVRVGDRGFERAITLDTEASDEAIGEVFRSAEARTAALAIVEAGFVVHFNERSVMAELFSPEQTHVNATAIEPIVRAASSLARQAPLLDPSRFGKRAQVGRVIVGAILGLSLLATGLLAPGALEESGAPLAALPRSILPLPTMLPGVGLGAAAFIAAFAGLRFALRRKNASVDLPLVLALFVVLCALGVGALEAGNRLLDDAPLVVHDARISSKETAESRRSGRVTEWNLIVPSWRPDASEMEIGVDLAFYDALKVGDLVRVVVHPGFFGYEWGATVERPEGRAADRTAPQP